MNLLRSSTELAAAELLLAAARVTPARWWRRFGGWAGALAGFLDRRHRKVALENLTVALEHRIGSERVAAIARACWIHFGHVLFDGLRLPLRPRRELDRMVHYHGWRHIENAYARGRGVLLFSAHYGHWELVALMQGYRGLPLTMVVRPLDNPRLDRRLRALRSASGNAIIPHRGSVRGMLQTLRRGGGVAILIDQDARDSGVFVPFFGQPASTTPALASLALKTGAAVVPVFSVPRGDGSYDITYEPPVTFRVSGDHEADVVRITAQCTAIIERWVIAHPELWLWMHRRWKTRPQHAGA